MEKIKLKKYFAIILLFTQLQVKYFLITNNNLDDGNVYSWGEDINKTGILGLGTNYNQSKPIINNFFINKKISTISISEKHACAIDSKK